jgi:Lanthionine synthetase C-like protein
VGGAGVIFDPAAHEPLRGEWNETRAREAIAAVVADAEAALGDCVWPAHELDDEVAPEELTTLYLGSAGMVWALRRLGSRADLDDVAEQTAARYRPVAEYAARFGDPRPSLLMGETGVLLVTRSDDRKLQALVEANAENPTWELMWGSPGTILAARHAGLDAGRSPQRLVEEWDRGDGVWTQDLGGRTHRFLGPVHGFAGNVHALRGHLGDDELRARVEPVLRAHAQWEDDLVNWPPVVGGECTRVQWCHGAPGIVSTLGDLMPEDLLLAGAELTWRAGPLVKGPGLCHGTAGNGYAFLRVFDVTGDELWLERARAFAMHALAQTQGRYTLFTGDVGAALFAQACLAGDARFPIMDVL